jgi:hypothetical protein
MYLIKHPSSLRRHKSSQPSSRRIIASIVRTAICVAITVVVFATLVRAITSTVIIASVWRRTITFADFLAFIAHAYSTAAITVVATLVRAIASAVVIASVWRRTITFTDFLAFIAHAYSTAAITVVATLVRAITSAVVIASVWRRTLTFTNFLAFIAHAYSAAAIIIDAALVRADTLTIIVANVWGRTIADWHTCTIITITNAFLVISAIIIAATFVGTHAFIVGRTYHALTITVTIIAALVGTNAFTLQITRVWWSTIATVVNDYALVIIRAVFIAAAISVAVALQNAKTLANIIIIARACVIFTSAIAILAAFVGAEAFTILIATVRRRTVNTISSRSRIRRLRHAGIVARARLIFTCAIGIIAALIETDAFIILIASVW